MEAAASGRGESLLVCPNKRQQTHNLGFYHLNDKTQI